MATEYRHLDGWRKSVEQLKQDHPERWAEALYDAVSKWVPSDRRPVSTEELEQLLDIAARRHR